MKICPNCHRTYPTGFANCPADGTPLAQSGEWSEGTVIRGKYRIVKKIGQGAMGSVYKALHTDFNELHALKNMALELSNDKVFVKRFKLEAVSARRLQHPNVVRVEDVDETEDGQPFMVMEYLDGRSLSELIKSEGSLGVERVCSIAKQTASALDAAHRLEIVHRDIKPQNIMVIDSASGEVAKVLDFGIARIKEALGGATTAMSLSHTGMVIGTPPYMSPEQAKGISGDQLDGRSDLYSLGVVMYQMLTGSLPLKGDTPMQFMLAHVQTQPFPIEQVRPDLHIPRAISDIVMKCLAKDPDQRFQTGGELTGEIEAFLSGSAHDQRQNIQPLSSSPLGESQLKNTQQPVRTFLITESEDPVVLPRPKPRPARSSSGKWIATGAVILAVLMAGGGYWIHASHERGSVESTSVKSAASQPAVTAPEAAPAIAAPKPTTAEAPPSPATASPATPMAKKAESPKAEAAPIVSAPEELAPTPALPSQPEPGPKEPEIPHVDAIPNFAGTWVEINPQNSARPLMLKVVQIGAQITVYLTYTQVFGNFFLKADISEGSAIRSLPQGCAPRFQKPGYNYDRPGTNIFHLSLRGSTLLYEQDTQWMSPCDGHPIGTETNTKEMQRLDLQQ
ncbi:MAG: protein kinase [Candidatus Acidiferrales bacterium]|jgi:serine/threonine-protein kinase